MPPIPDVTTMDPPKDNWAWTHHDDGYHEPKKELPAPLRGVRDVVTEENPLEVDVFYSMRSPLRLRSEVKKVRRMQSGEAAPAPTKDVQPPLAHVAGGWQPGVIVEEQDDGWATVFLPDVPSVATGRLYLVGEDRLLRLDVPPGAYRKKLAANGHGSADWLQALPEARPDAAGTALRTGPPPRFDSGSESTILRDSSP